MPSVRASVLDGVLAGMMVSIGGTVLLSCDNRYLGAGLFCIALLAICYFGFNLYTGKVGYLYLDHSRANLSVTFSGLLGNLCGTLLMGLLIGAALPQLPETAAAACGKRLLQLPLQTLLRGFFCGILMYVAVWIYREKQSLTGIFSVFPSLCFPALSIPSPICSILPWRGCTTEKASFSSCSSCWATVSAACSSPLYRA